MNSVHTYKNREYLPLAAIITGSGVLSAIIVLAGNAWPLLSLPLFMILWGLNWTPYRATIRDDGSVTFYWLFARQTLTANNLWLVQRTVVQPRAPYVFRVTFWKRFGFPFSINTKTFGAKANSGLRLALHAIVKNASGARQPNRQMILDHLR